MFTRASESTDFRHKSTEKSQKSLKNQVCNSSGTGDRGFESRHFDQKRTGSPCGCLFFFGLSGVLARPSCVATWVRILSAERVKQACKRQATVYSNRKSRHLDQDRPMAVFFVWSKQVNSHPRVLRRLENIVVLRRLPRLAAYNSLFSSGASPKTVINCLPPRLPATLTKKEQVFFTRSFYLMIVLLL